MVKCLDIIRSQESGPFSRRHSKSEPFDIKILFYNSNCRLVKNYSGGSIPERFSKLEYFKNPLLNGLVLKQL